jgi:hypothetical protein
LPTSSELFDLSALLLGQNRIDPGAHVLAASLSGIGAFLLRGHELALPDLPCRQLRAELGDLRLFGGALRHHLAPDRVELRDLIFRQRERFARSHDPLDTLRGDRSAE